MAEMPTTVLIVDDDAEFRAIARELLAADGLEIVGEAESGAEAISAALCLKPDVVLLDVNLPDMDGFSAARMLAGSGNGPCVVLCSVTTPQRVDHVGSRCGATAFLPKIDVSAANLRRLIATP